MPTTSISRDPRAPHLKGCTCPRCRPEPVPGDVVLVPVAPRHGRRGRMEPTPCLVADVEQADGERRLRLLPGAPATGGPARRGDVFATTSDLEDVHGLVGPHPFAATRPVVIPLGGGDGADGGDGPVILGSLGGAARSRLDAAHRRPRAGRDAGNGAETITAV